MRQQDIVNHGGHGSSGDSTSGMQHGGHGSASGRRVPGFPADMMDMMGMLSEAELRKINRPETRGMRGNWFAGVEALHTIIRVLPPDLYDEVVSGKGDIAPGASVPGGGPGQMPGMRHNMPGMHQGHQHGDEAGSKKEGAKGNK